jgi:hypothetical protein
MKRVILVGNGPSVLNKDNAELIDSYDVVVRFNWFHIKGFEKQVGTKTDIWFTTTSCKERIKQKYERIYEHSWQFDPEKDKTFNLIKADRPDVIKITSETLDEMQKYSQNKAYRTYSTGAIAAWVLLKEYDHVDIIGFDWWQEEKHHYGDNQSRGSIHKPEEEFKFMARLVVQGKLTDLNDNSMLNDKHKIWQAIHQPFELAYHKQGNYRWRENLWQEQWDAVFGFTGLERDAFNAGETIIDVGCGSRPALEWFDTSSDCRKAYIDPLLSQYMEIPQMADFWKDKKDDAFSLPAEQCVESLVGKGDFVLCWNVLDHCYDPNAVMDNIVKYAKIGGMVMIGTDFGEKSNIGHPGFSSSGFWKIIEKHFDIIKQQKSFVHRQLAILLKRKS